VRSKYGEAHAAAKENVNTPTTQWYALYASMPFLDDTVRRLPTGGVFSKLDFVQDAPIHPLEQ
jgi:hypothetical protein